MSETLRKYRDIATEFLAGAISGVAMIITS